MRAPMLEKLFTIVQIGAIFSGFCGFEFVKKANEKVNVYEIFILAL